MTELRLIEKETNIPELKMTFLPWDVVVKGVEYQVVRIEGYVHTFGGPHGGENNLWMYPRGTEPTYETLIEYQCVGCGVCWGIKYNPHNYVRTKYDETECFTSGGAMITRNGKDFYFCRKGIVEAQYLISKIQEHPLELNMYGYKENMIGRKVWFRGEPAIVTGFVDGQACVLLKPDGINKFMVPPEFKDEPYLFDEEEELKINIFSDHIWWFRD